MAATSKARFTSGYYVANMLVVASYLLVRLAISHDSSTAAAGASAAAAAALPGQRRIATGEELRNWVGLGGSRHCNLVMWTAVSMAEAPQRRKQVQAPSCVEPESCVPLRTARRAYMQTTLLSQEMQCLAAFVAIIAFKLWRRRSWDHAAAQVFFYSKVSAVGAVVCTSMCSCTTLCGWRHHQSAEAFGVVTRGQQLLYICRLSCLDAGPA